MAEVLDNLPNGSDVLIDANIFIYGLTAKSTQCKSLLERCSREEVTGVSLFEALNNATHYFMKAEVLEKRLCVTKAMQYLSANPEQIKLLTEYWINTERLLAINLLFLPLDLEMVKGAQPIRVHTGLLTNDSMIVSAMKEYGISLLATNDRRFDAVPGITVFSPTDVA